MSAREPAIRLSPDVLQEISRHAAASYPHEACGALVGAREDVRLSLPLPNRDARAPEVGFLVDPNDYLRVESEAESLGLSLLGFWHSHPDGLALPSSADRAYAWEGLLTVIVSVTHGAPEEISAWRLDGQDAPFREVPVEDGFALVSDLGGGRC